jgi:hypothetical protein
MKKGRYREAFESFRRIRNTELIAARELVLQRLSCTYGMSC